jgi:hypothetical protein
VGTCPGDPKAGPPLACAAEISGASRGGSVGATTSTGLSAGPSTGETGEGGLPPVDGLSLGSARDLGREDDERRADFGKGKEEASSTAGTRPPGTATTGAGLAACSSSTGTAAGASTGSGSGRGAPAKDLAAAGLAGARRSAAWFEPASERELDGGALAT